MTRRLDTMKLDLKKKAQNHQQPLLRAAAIFECNNRVRRGVGGTLNVLTIIIKCASTRDVLIIRRNYVHDQHIIMYYIAFEWSRYREMAKRSLFIPIFFYFHQSRPFFRKATQVLYR